MAELQDEFEIEFNRLREGQKLIRDLLKERREMMNDGNLDAHQISKSQTIQVISSAEHKYRIQGLIDSQLEAHKTLKAQLNKKLKKAKDDKEKLENK